MQLKFQKTLVPEQDGAAKIPAMCWSPNNAKLAVATADRSILLFDEQGERKDKFSTKPVDAKYGKKSYVIKALAFSPDSTRLAVGQSDNMVFVYRIGEGWSDKKVICNKFMQPAAVTALIWPTEQALVVGLADGKVRLSNVKSNKASTLYNTDVFVCSLAPQIGGKAMLSGHADGSIVRYSFDSNGAQGKICTHPSPPYALVWTASSVIAAGCDKRVISYAENGRILQQFDYSAENDEREFTTAITNPAGQSVVIGSYDHFRVFNWNQRRGAWDEGKTLQIQYLYTITALSWKPDGSKVVCGTLCGSVRMFDCSLKRGLIRNKFETTHVGPSQVIVKDITTGNRATIRSELGYEIGEIKVMGRDRYVIAHTPDSLLLADIESGKSSEIPWQSGGNEKFYFDSENVAMIFNAGELTIVEYGINDILGSARTEFMNPHLISVRINERKHKTNEDVKRMAYLIDLKTISILDLRFGSTFGQINHDTKIDWLELNETGRKLLFRDKRYRLTLYNIENEQKTTLLSYGSYVQWVPGSDVVVAQSRDNLCVWYNIETPDRVTMFPIKGDIQAVVREEGLTEVIVLEGSMQAAYQLDEGLIEFGTAMDDNDFGRAITFLEQLDPGADADAMWRQLAAIALEQRRLHVAQRCYAALGDIARARFLEQTLRIAQQAAKQIGGDGTQFYQVRARLAIMNKEFKDAERIYLEQNCLDEAIEMYQSLHKWDEALELAEARNHPDVESLKAKYYRHLADTGQDEKAGEIKQKEGDYMAAVDLYLKGNLPVRAARVVTEHSEFLNNTDLVQSVAVALIKNELFEKAGELFEKTKDFDRALECYRKGKALNKAIELARYSFPEQVVKLEEEWGDMLVQQKQMDAAINHFIESGNSLKALDAAIRARQWNKAVQIVDVVDNSDLAKEYYGKIAEHYASVKEYDRAERFYIEAGMNKEAVAMYNRAGKWQEAHRLASEFMGTDETSEMYLRQAAELEESGRFKEAEDLYVAVGQPNKAIAMYKKADQHEPMMRLVRRFHGEHVQETHKHLGSDLEEKGQLREAEQHYMDAGEWKSAVNMYRAAEQWEDAYRVAKAAGGETAQKQVAYLWAKSLGGDSAVKLLQKFNLLDEAIDFACDNGAFDFAFDMCRLGLKAKMPVVHLKYALQLEEEGKLPQAEQQFLQAGKPKEAVLMYVHQQNWDEAQRLAEAHCPEAIPEVYIGQARIAFEQQDYAKAESYLLRANKPDIILRSYKELGMWPDALRICKEYLPARLAELQDEYDNEQLKSGAKGALSFVAQAKDWEAQGDYERAVSCYLKVVPPLTMDETLMLSCWTKAGDLAVKFLSEEQALVVVEQVAVQLQEIKRYSEAAELLLSANQTQQAVDVFVSAGEWGKAKKIAVELAPELAAYVDEKYKDSLRSEGKAGQLVDVDVLSGIDLYIEKGQWDRALDIAKQQNNPALLDKYVAMYATELISNGNFMAAVQVFEKFGAAANPSAFNIYKRLIDEVISTSNTNTAAAYTTWASLRNMLLHLVTNLHSVNGEFDPRYVEVFDRYLVIAHYYALRSALLKVAEAEPAMKLAAMKLSVSLLRHCDLIPADKAFYEAGVACKDFGPKYESMAFVFLNHYLDLAEAIEEQNAEGIDNTDLENTDIPTEIPLPDQIYLTPEQHEDMKEWVLAVSVDKQIEKRLVTDQRGCYEANLVAQDGSVSQSCMVTGYPVLGASKTFGTSDKVADRDDWNKLLMVHKTTKAAELDDVQKFIASWTKTAISLAL